MTPDLFAAMTPFETASLVIAAVTAFASVVSAVAASVAAIGIWRGIRAMVRANEDRAALEAEDRKEDRRATQAILVSLERQGRVLEELLRRGADR